MILLIRDDCPHCREFENTKEEHPDIMIFKVFNGMVDLGDGIMQQIDKKITSLPALITGKAVYIGADMIREQINSMGEK